MKINYRNSFLHGAVIALAASSLAVAQTQAPVTDQNEPTFAQNAQGPAPADAGFAQNGPAPFDDSQDDRGGWRRLGQRGPGGPQRRDDGRPAFAPAGPPPNLPAQLTIPSGAFVTIRVNQMLDSDHSQPGQPFAASLVKPIVVDGVIVADRGQTLSGRVAESQKAGRVKGVSRLAIELTEVSLVDGSQVPLRSQLITYEGPSSVGRDATAVGTAAGVGALIGAAAQGGAEAGIGAGAGAGAALIGVLLTRGRPTVIYPESVLTFRVETPITISTARAPQAFRAVGPGDYSQPTDQPRTLVQRQAPPPSLYGGYGGWGYPGWYGPGWYGPRYYYGPSIGIGFYRGFGGRRGRW